MCHNIKLLSRTKSGELSFCKACNVFHLVFNNLFFELNVKEFNRLRSYIYTIKVDYWEHKYACPKIRRKIPLPSMQDNLIIMFNRKEIKELRLLLSANPVGIDNLLSVDDIDYAMIIN